jgi:multidrug transporter EmrE-like cation transporter
MIECPLTKLSCRLRRSLPLASFTSSPIALLLASVLLGVCGQFLLKSGLLAASHGKEAVGAAAILAAVKSIGQPLVFLGFVCYAMSSITWIMVLKKVDLNVAYPMISIGYVFAVFLSPIILKEQVRWQIAVPGLIFIVLGVSMIGLGMAKR